jgi:hypothetical protein
MRASPNGRPASEGGAASSGGREPSYDEVAEELARHVDGQGNVPVHLAEQLAQAKGWQGRLLDVLRLFTASEQQMAYLAGGRRAEDLLRAARPWVDSPLSIGELHLIITCGGWDPEPFVPLAKAGMLDRFLKTARGTVRRIQGELAGGWLSDECALAEPEEILDVVRSVLESEDGPLEPTVGEARA